MTSSIANLLPHGRIIVVCGRADDARAWRDMLGPARCLAVALDDAPPKVRTRPLQGASGQLAWQHDAIAGLDGSGWLARLADDFDPDHTAALVLPDPLDPPAAGDRRRLGRRQPAWQLFEDKTVVDALWDTIGVPCARSIVADGATDLELLGVLVDHGTGVVCSRQPIGAGPCAGGDGIWWWRDGPPPGALSAGAGSCRIRLMPLLEGVPVRLHGLVLARRVIPFPAMEIVTLPRTDRGTFLCAGAVPTLGQCADLAAQTENIGTRLRDRLDYRGGFSVDGIVTADGFLPTDFNARLTSAMEATSSQLRVQLHAANVLAREGTEPEPAVVEDLAVQVFTAGDTYTLYGAAACAGIDSGRPVAARWDGTRLVVSDDERADVRLALAPSVRGWLLTANLTAARLPLGHQVGRLAPEVFRISDQLFGTDFGDLAPPFGTKVDPLPAPRAEVDSAQTLRRRP